MLINSSQYANNRIPINNCDPNEGLYIYMRVVILQSSIFSKIPCCDPALHHDLPERHPYVSLLPVYPCLMEQRFFGALRAGRYKVGAGSKARQR